MKTKMDKTLGGILVLLMVLMVLSVLWQVFSRYLLDSASSFTEELSRYLFIWIGILGAAYASGQQTHLAIDILPPKLSPVNRVRLRIGINILIILFSLTVLVIGGGNLVYVNYLLGQYSAALNLPLSFVYIVVPLSGILVIYYKVNEIIYPKKYLV
ncbi:TRAP transporter small permease [Zunongwangia sp. F260]|uniref:TRAP transporter small permease n=2 Tax=Autumnicola TaxID=3160927 RepID=A0ABU3CFK1_9FLAO|nr:MULTISPECIES: TRAP transporter small permease [unclassified Zunongwangia]MDT0645129.1 TRAP transporter small permease [Zunongwangia sp. F260]MDT0687196.1 TRAP transporter small permease [Zunongwangia sp. F225]